MNFVIEDITMNLLIVNTPHIWVSVLRNHATRRMYEKKRVGLQTLRENQKHIREELWAFKGREGDWRFHHLAHFPFF
jgi:hypothetical protein